MFLAVRVVMFSATVANCIIGNCASWRGTLKLSCRDMLVLKTFGDRKYKYNASLFKCSKPNVFYANILY